MSKRNLLDVDWEYTDEGYVSCPDCCESMHEPYKDQDHEHSPDCEYIEQLRRKRMTEAERIRELLKAATQEDRAAFFEKVTDGYCIECGAEIQDIAWFCESCSRRAAE